MKTLLILRHAKSSRDDDSIPDHDRPLNKRGLEAAPEMGKLVRKEDLAPELILSSSAVRARATAELFAGGCKYHGEIVIRPDLYSFEAEPYLAALSGVTGQYSRVMVVGHNPAMEELVQALTGQLQPMPTAAVAVIQLPIEQWSELTATKAGEQRASKSPPALAAAGTLLHLWRPKEL